MDDWLPVLCYASTALACVHGRRSARAGARSSVQHGHAAGESERRGRDRRAAYGASVWFWTAAAAGVLVAWGLRRTDLTAGLMDAVRGQAVDHGWYADRRVLQAAALGVVAAGVVGGFVVILRATRELLPRHVPPFIGVLVLMLDLLARATSHHHVDAALGPLAGGMRPLESGGLALLLASGLLGIRGFRRRAALTQA